MFLPQLQPLECVPSKHLAVNDHHNPAGAFAIPIKSGPVLKGVKDVTFETNKIVSLRHMEISFYHWKVFICALLWYNYWHPSASGRCWGGEGKAWEFVTEHHFRWCEKS